MRNWGEFWRRAFVLYCALVALIAGASIMAVPLPAAKPSHIVDIGDGTRFWVRGATQQEAEQAYDSWAASNGYTSDPRRRPITFWQDTQRWAGDVWQILSDAFLAVLLPFVLWFSVRWLLRGLKAPAK